MDSRPRSSPRSDALSAGDCIAAPRSCFATGWLISSGATGRSTTTARRSASTGNFCIRPPCWKSGPARLVAGRVHVPGPDGRVSVAASVCGDENGGLIAGVPEADTRKETGRYFHNNAWMAKGLRRWADLCQRQKGRSLDHDNRRQESFGGMARDTLGPSKKHGLPIRAIGGCLPKLNPSETASALTGSRTLLPIPTTATGRNSSPADSAGRRWPTGSSPHASRRGAVLRMTRFADTSMIGRWPIPVRALVAGTEGDFLFSLYGHVAYHQAEGHLTAYEQVSFPPGKKRPIIVCPANWWRRVPPA